VPERVTCEAGLRSRPHPGRPSGIQSPEHHHHNGPAEVRDEGQAGCPHAATASPLTYFSSTISETTSNCPHSSKGERGARSRWETGMACATGRHMSSLLLPL